MNITSTPIPHLQIIQLNIFHDSRGYFVERYNQREFEKLSITNNFVQDNFSFSHPKVLRGLHFQKNPDQAKLVGCISGKIWDVAIDIRKNSPTFGQHFGVELSGENGKLLYIPAGFAHGFCVLGDEPAHVAYKVDGFYCKEGDGGIAFDDSELNINWPISDPIISDKDKALMSFSDYKKSAIDFEYK